MIINPDLINFARRHNLPSEALEELHLILSQVSGDDRGTLLDTASDPKTTETTEPPPVRRHAHGRPGEDTDLTGPFKHEIETQAQTRYEDLGPLGEGGMGEVRRVLDQGLGRVMALKVIRKELMQNQDAVARFVAEAQATAQLQHPGIVPVHELGITSDGRHYFTMKEVQGRTLDGIIQDVHRGEGEATGWTSRRLLGAFAKSCEAMAYAHSQGVIHRDLKPENIMLGTHGEVLVLDWGIAKVKAGFVADDPLNPAGIKTHRTDNPEQYATRAGSVNGTPAYMAPEQAKGDLDLVDARSDVYALGAILYEILTGDAPYTGDSHMQVLFQVIKGPPEPLQVSRDEVTTDTQPLNWMKQGEEPRAVSLAPGLVAICDKAMQRDRDLRYEDAAALASDVASWLDGEVQRDRALALVATAKGAERASTELETHAALALRRAAMLLDGVEPWASESEKAPGWAKEDEASSLRRQAEHKRFEAEQHLRLALGHDTALAEAHEQLARHHQSTHRNAESQRDEVAADHAMASLQTHVAALPEDHPERARFLSYISGEGFLTLHTEPRDVDATLYSYLPHNRRLVPGSARSLGRTPLVDLRLPMGSYLLMLSKAGYTSLSYPFIIDRQRHWDGVRPSITGSSPIPLMPLDELVEDEVYVPAGWFWSGDVKARGAAPRRQIWVDGFVIKRNPVTNTEFITFLNHLVAQGRELDAVFYAPREGSFEGDAHSAMLYDRDQRGMFVLPPEGDRRSRSLHGPVVSVTWKGALAYTRWLAQITGQPWRLPMELEWEKAARGTDGRAYPWGDAFDPSWCCMGLSRPDTARIAETGQFKVDRSPYGVEGMAGNVRDWCADVWRAEPVVSAQIASVVFVEPKADEAADLRVYRGGAWNTPEMFCHTAYRVAGPVHNRNGTIGFRPVRSVG